jgi:DNA-binding response OmpR family regulator
MSSAQILIVEDEPLSADVLSRRLESRGYKTVVAANADECFRIVKSARPDLILMDIALPGMSGIDAVRELRKSWSHDSLPVIMVSAMIDSDDVVTALEAGANDYVVKPVNFRVLLARIAVMLRVKSTVSMLVEAERQRVMVESLSQSASQLATPMDNAIDALENAMRDNAINPDTHHKLDEVLACFEKMVDVIEKIRSAGAEQDASYTERLKILGQ